MKPKTLLTALSSQLGLQINEKQNIIYGKIDQYPVACLCSWSQPLTFYFSLLDPTNKVPSVAAIKEFAKNFGIKLGGTLKIVNYSVTVTIPHGLMPKPEKMVEQIRNTVECFKGLDLQPCCQITGELTNTNAYLQNGKEIFWLSEEGFKQLMTSNQISANVEENFPLGMIGAFFGALLGGLVVLLLLALDRAAVIAGFITAAAACFGYKSLGKKFSVKGAVLSLVFSLLSTFLMVTLFVAYAISSQFSIDLLSAVYQLPELLKDPHNWAIYTRVLFKPMLVTLIGAAFCIFIFLRDSRHQNKLIPIN